MIKKKAKIRKSVWELCDKRYLLLFRRYRNLILAKISWPRKDKQAKEEVIREPSSLKELLSRQPNKLRISKNGILIMRTRELEKNEIIPN